MNKADQLLTLAAIRQVELQRLASRFLMEALEDLRGLESSILLAIDKHDPTGAVRAATQNKRTSDLLLEISDETRRIMRELESRLTDDFEEAVEAQVEDERKSLLLVYGIAVTLEATLAQIRRKPLLVAGATIRDWLRNITRDVYFRVSAAIREGVIAGEDASGLKRRVKGEEKVIRRDGPLAPAERGLETVIRTAVDKLPGHVLPDLLPGSKFGKHGWQQISVLDNRTTDICRSYAWRKWDAEFEPVGHKLPYNGGPPRHPNCRSRIIMIFLDDPEPAHVTFQQLIERLNPGKQVEIFGSKNIAAWRRGVISDSELLRQANRPITLEALRELTEKRVLP